MKLKFFNLLILSVVLIGQTKAQKTGLTFGTKLAINADLINSSIISDTSNLNWNAGIYARKAGKKFGLQVEALYGQKNINLRGEAFKALVPNYYSLLSPTAQLDTSTSLNSNHNIGVKFVSLPVLLQYRLTKKMWLQAGPQFTGIVSLNNKDSFFKDTKALFTKGQLSLLGGFSYDFSSKLNFGLRYISALNSISISSVNNAWANKSVQFNIGYLFQ